MTNKPVVVVTGGSQGIGLAIAKIFVQKKWRVALVARSKDRLLQAQGLLVEEVADAEILPLSVDITQREEVKAAFTMILNHWGPVQALINNAGTPVQGGFLKTDPEVWEKGVRLHVHGSYYAAWHAAQHMAANGGGSIVNIGSAAGVNPPPGLPLYAGAKGALVAMSRALAVDLASSDITVNAVCPGPVDTATFRAATPPDIYRDRTLSIPLGRLISPEEIAETVYFLCSPAARNITGETILVDGGAAAIGPYSINLYKQRLV